MAKLTQDRDTKRREGVLFSFEAAEQIFCGAMVALNSDGKLVGATSDGKQAVGIAEEAGKAGAKIRVRRGVFNFEYNGLTLADIGSQCAVVDDQTVGKATTSSGTQGTGTQGTGTETTTSASAIAGILLDIDAAGAWVKI